MPPKVTIFSSLSHRAVCFLWLPKLTSDVSFNNVTSIGESAFERCGNGWLNLTINDLYCYEISDAAFRNFNGTVNLNGTVKVIYQNAFCNSNNNENFRAKKTPVLGKVPSSSDEGTFVIFSPVLSGTSSCPILLCSQSLNGCCQ